MIPSQVRLPTRVGRLAIGFGSAFSLAMILVGMIGFFVADAWVANRIDTSLAYHARKYMAPVSGHPASARVVRDRILDWQRRKVLSERTYILFDRTGKMIAGRLDIKPPDTGYSDLHFRGGGRNLQTGRALATRLDDGALLVIVQHSEAARELNALLPLVVAVICFVALVIGVTVTFLFERATARRLNEALDTADAIAGGDLSRRIAVDSLDGMFRVQAESLNRMLDRMEELVRNQRLFSSNLAHDLRTPLTRLRGMLIDGAELDGTANSLVFDRAERECASIIAIFDALLRLAQIETGRHPAAMGILSLGPLLIDAAETMDPVIADHGGQLAVDRIDDVAIKGDQDLINQLLINLLENIAKHTPTGTSATLSLRREHDTAVIIVRDNGPGLAKHDRARAMQPFVRGRSAMNRQGTGLGLAIAQAIVRFHQGQIDLEDAAPGLVIRVRIPANDEPVRPVGAESVVA